MKEEKKRIQFTWSYYYSQLTFWSYKVTELCAAQKIKKTRKIGKQQKQ